MTDRCRDQLAAIELKVDAVLRSLEAENEMLAELVEVATSLVFAWSQSHERRTAAQLADPWSVDVVALAEEKTMIRAASARLQRCLVMLNGEKGETH